MNDLLRVLHLFIAINLLISSTGVVFFEHLCQKKGRLVSIFGRPDSCCKKKSSKIKACFGETKTGCNQKISNNKPTGESSISRKPCCSDNHKYCKISVESQLAGKKVQPQGKFVLDLGAPSVGEILSAAFNYKATVNPWLTHTDPPLMRSILLMTQTFRC